MEEQLNKNRKNMSNDSDILIDEHLLYLEQLESSPYADEYQKLMLKNNKLNKFMNLSVIMVFVSPVCGFIIPIEGFAYVCMGILALCLVASIVLLVCLNSNEIKAKQILKNELLVEALKKKFNIQNIFSVKEEICHYEQYPFFENLKSKYFTNNEHIDSISQLDDATLIQLFCLYTLNCGICSPQTLCNWQLGNITYKIAGDNNGKPFRFLNFDLGYRVRRDKRIDYAKSYNSQLFIFELATPMPRMCIDIDSNRQNSRVLHFSQNDLSQEEIENLNQIYQQSTPITNEIIEKLAEVWSALLCIIFIDHLMIIAPRNSNDMFDIKEKPLLDKSDSDLDHELTPVADDLYKFTKTIELACMNISK